MEIITQLSFNEKTSVGNSTCTDIQIVNDNILEFDETFIVILTALDNTYTITTASSSAVIVILEDSDDCKFQTNNLLSLQCVLFTIKPNGYFIET